MMMRKQYHNTIFDRCSLCCPVSVPQRVLGTTFVETASIPVTWVLHQLDIRGLQSFYWIVRTISFYFVPSLCRFGNLPWQVLPSPHLRTQAWIRKWEQFVFWANQPSLYHTTSPIYQTTQFTSPATSMNPQPRVAIYGYLNWQMLESHLFKSYMHIPAGAAAG